MTRYVVTWSVDTEAESLDQAATLAWQDATAPAAGPPVLYVRDVDSNEVRVASPAVPAPPVPVFYTVTADVVETTAATLRVDQTAFEAWLRTRALWAQAVTDDPFTDWDADTQATALLDYRRAADGPGLTWRPVGVNSPPPYVTDCRPMPVFDEVRHLYVHPDGHPLTADEVESYGLDPGLRDR